MTKNNGNLIPKENYKQVEEIREIDYKVPSYEEFMKNYEGKVNYDDLSGGDISVGKGYGPGNTHSSYGGTPRNNREWRNWESSGGRSVSSPGPFQSIGESAGFVVETYLKASAAAMITTATGGLAPIVGGSMWIGGELLQSTNDSFLRFVGSNVKSIGNGTFFGGLFANLTIGEVAKKVGISFETLEWLYETKGTTETIYAMGKHSEHRNRGISYDSDCEVCKR